MCEYGKEIVEVAVVKVGVGVATGPEDAVATNGIATVVEVTEEVVVDVPEDITLIKPDTDTALLVTEGPGLLTFSCVSVITW